MCIFIQFMICIVISSSNELRIFTLCGRWLRYHRHRSVVPMIHFLLLLVVDLVVGSSQQFLGNDSEQHAQKPKQKEYHKKHDPMDPFHISLELQTLQNRSTDKPIAPNAGSWSLKVVVCALMKHEDEYVDEWITYNKYLGFDHIHIYDNNHKPSSHLAALPRKYKKFVDVYHFPAKSPQLRAYTHCGMRYKQANVWVAFIDGDEFIVLRKHKTIKELLFDLPFGGALSLNRIFFGSNHLLHYDARPVVQRFTRRKEGLDSLVKTIAYLPDVTLFEIHYTLLRDGMKRVDTHGRRQSPRKSYQTNGNKDVNGTEDIAVIYHYYTKSFDEFRDKRQRGDASKFIRVKQYQGEAGEKLIAKQFAEYDQHANAVYDPAAWLFYQSKMNSENRGMKDIVGTNGNTTTTAT